MTNSMEMDIAKTIQQQIKYPNAMKFFSWGGHAWTVLPAGKTDNGENYTLGGLAFRVNGMKLKQGRVEVQLMGDDTYKVSFFNRLSRMIKTQSNVYFDELQELIDNVVEKIPEYEY